MSGIDLMLIDTDNPSTIEKHKTSEIIYEWYLWSFFNVIFGFFIMGFIAIILSFRTTMYKEADNSFKAHLWSYITLLWNILATCTGFSLIFYIVLQYERYS